MAPHRPNLEHVFGYCVCVRVCVCIFIEWASETVRQRAESMPHTIIIIINMILDLKFDAQECRIARYTRKLARCSLNGSPLFYSIDNEIDKKKGRRRRRRRKKIRFEKVFITVFRRSALKFVHTAHTARNWPLHTAVGKYFPKSY